jgi:hypothetical protein
MAFTMGSWHSCHATASVVVNAEIVPVLSATVAEALLISLSSGTAPDDTWTSKVPLRGLHISLSSAQPEDDHPASYHPYMNTHRPTSPRSSRVAVSHAYSCGKNVDNQYLTLQLLRTTATVTDRNRAVYTTSSMYAVSPR